jgi:predicted nucleic acid-binding protein
MTAVDTNVLIDVLIADPEHAEASATRLDQAAREGPLVICDIVYAELAACFGSPDEPDAWLAEAGIRREPFVPEDLRVAAAAWRRYVTRRPRGLQCPHCGADFKAVCNRCGAPIRVRQHILPDFLIGAMAVRVGRLLTRDKAFYWAHFPNLQII